MGINIDIKKFIKKENLNKNEIKEIVSISDVEWNIIKEQNKDIEFEKLDYIRKVNTDINDNNLVKINSYGEIKKNPLSIVFNFMPYLTYKGIIKFDEDEMSEICYKKKIRRHYFKLIRMILCRAKKEFSIIDDEEIKLYAMNNVPKEYDESQIKRDTIKEMTDYEFSLFIRKIKDENKIIKYIEKRCVLFELAEDTPVKYMMDVIFQLDDKKRTTKNIISLPDKEYISFKQFVGDEASCYVDEMRLNEKNMNIIDIANKCNEIKNNLLKEVKGQNIAIEQLMKGIFGALIQKEVTDKPLASFFFFGPPGTGKTYTSGLLAKYLDVPIQVFDMSENSRDDDTVAFLGSDRTFRYAKRGAIFDFALKHENEKFILVFDEIEKASTTIKHSMLTLINSGFMTSPFDSIDISFKNAILIFTSNIGKALYEDSAYYDAIPFNKIREAFEKETDHRGQYKLSPEFVSRIGASNVILFKSLDTSGIKELVIKSIDDFIEKITKQHSLKISYDNNLPISLILNDASMDARIISRKTQQFIMNEIYELINLISHNDTLKNINRIKFKIDINQKDKDIYNLFVNPNKPKIIYVGEDFPSKHKHSLANDEEMMIDSVKKGADIVIIDPFFGGIQNDALSITDYNSTGINLYYKMQEIDSRIPKYILLNDEKDITESDKLTIMSSGAKGFIYRNKLNIDETLVNCYLEKQINSLKESGYVIDFKTRQEPGKNQLVIYLYDFKKIKSLDLQATNIMIKDIPDTKFSDVVGSEGAKMELRYFANYLKDPITFMQKGLRIPRGVLLYGPPGTGKTMLARALAGESKANFISLVGTDLLSSSIDVAKSKIRDVFTSARKYSPSIIFLDEVDAIGKRRNGGPSDSILNVLLTEMDGFKQDFKHPVFVLAATNYDVNSIDSAFVRRFDSKIYIDLPNKEERKSYIYNYIKSRTLNSVSDEAVDLLALRTVGKSLAIVENILEYASRIAFMSGKQIDDLTLIKACDEYNDGEEKEINNQFEHEMVAIHEAGHALISYIEGIEPTFVTIISRNNYGGYVFASTENKSILFRNDLYSRLRVSLAGRASEEVLAGSDKINLGAVDDLKNASKIAKNIITLLNNNQLFIDDERSESDKQKLNKEANELMMNEYRATVSLIEKNKEIVRVIANILMEKNYLTGDEFKKLISGNRINK